MAETDTTPEPAELLVCITCRAALAPEGGEEPRSGSRLLAALQAQDLPPGLTLRGVECLSNCDHGCTVALRGGKRWSYVYGNLGPDMAETVADGAGRYLNAADGLVPWRERSQHFRKNCIARLPPLTTPEIKEA